MNREIADKWTAALRSGQYTQTDGTLKCQWEDGSCSFCALGVLVDLFKREHPDVVMENVWPGGRVSFFIDDSSSIDVLPSEVQCWADMVGTSGPFRNGHFIQIKSLATGQICSFASVSEANDVVALSFPEIADLIDQHRDTM